MKVLSLNQARNNESLNQGRRVNPKKPREYRRRNMINDDVKPVFKLLWPNRLNPPCPACNIIIKNSRKAMRMKMRQAKMDL